MSETLQTTLGRAALGRWPSGGDPTLRAWDAADEYALDHLGEHWTVTAADASSAHVLVVNDGFGALATVLASAGATVTSWSDSHVAIRAAQTNAADNGLGHDAVTWCPSTTTPVGPFDAVVLKVPKTLRFLDDQLRRLRTHIDGDTVVIGAGMTKLVHRSTIDAFATTIGPTPTTRARKKARLLLPTLDPSLVVSPPAAARTWTTTEGVNVTNRANVFSSERLDGGTRVLLDHLPTPGPGANVVDLGCGNGVVGATMLVRQPTIELWCCDESHDAVASARATVASVSPDGPDRHRFLVTDATDGIPDASVDLVVVNPPFHAGGARTIDVAARMFAGAKRILREGGTLVVVGNRHLGHHAILRRQFTSVDVVSKDDAFVVVVATR